MSELRCATMPASVWFVLALSLSSLMASHAADCQPLPYKDQIDVLLTNLLTNQAGEGEVVEVDVLNMTYTCQALGTSLGTYRYLSVIVTYIMTAESLIKQGQFEMVCINPNAISGWDFIRRSLTDLPAGYNFFPKYLETYSNCSSCSKDAGNQHHCEPCHRSCERGCTGTSETDCCNCYNSSGVCVTNTCQVPTEVGCQADRTLIMSPSGNPELTIKIPWPETNIGEVAEVKCPCGNITLGTDALVATRYCGEDFTNGGKWSDPNVSPCNFSDLSREICNLVELEVDKRISQLNEITSEASTLEKTEVAISVSVLVTATEDVSGNLTLSKSFLNVVDNILQVTSETLKESQQNFNTSAKILEAIQSVADSIPIKNTSQPVIIARSQFAVSAQEVETNQFMQTFSFTAEDHSHISNISRINSKDLYFGEMINKSTASISLSNNLLNALHNISKSRITHAIYLSELAFLRRENSNLEVNSVIISASVVGASLIRGLKNPPVILSFKISKTDEDPVCSFWDPTLDFGYGNWSNIGCYVNSSNDDEVICHCDHLTSFSILLDVSPSIEPVKSPFSHALNAVTYIGIIISLFCLIIVSASYLYSRKLRNSKHGQLLMNLCFALMGLYLSFICALHTTPVTGLCAFFSALLQYFFLVTFMSMTAEAINLYFKLVVVLGYKISHYVIKAVTVSWVLPLFIVVFCFAPKYENYVSLHFCRVFNAPYYVGMIVPFLIFYIFNWIIFGVIFVSLIHKRYRSSVKETDKKSKNSFLHQQLIVVTSLSVLFGLGWGIGLFATQDAHSSETVRDILSAIFVLITAFHGLFIFIMNGIRSKDVRSVWKHWFRLATQKNFDEFSSSTMLRFRSIKERNVSSTANPAYAPSFTFGRNTFQRSTHENSYQDVKAVNALHEEIPVEKRVWSKASEGESRQQEERHGLTV